MGDDDATGSLDPEQASGSSSPHPAPPARGWYRIPDNPNYEHFWDGQRWESQRYWGGASPEGGSATSGPPPVVDVPASQEWRTPWNAGPPQQAPLNGADPAGQAPEVRFYGLTTLIVPPVFIALCALLASSDIPRQPDRIFGIVAAVLAVVFIVFFLRRPYVAIVRGNDSLTFKSLTGSKETTISRVSRIGVIMGSRGGGSWAFYFDGTKAVLGDIGGLRLKRYLVARNPALG